MCVHKLLPSQPVGLEITDVDVKRPFFLGNLFRLAFQTSCTPWEPINR